MEGNTIISMAGGFIALSIMLGIGTLILGGSTTDCTTISDFNSTTPSAGELAGNYTTGTTASDYYSTGGINYGTQSGWAAQCITNNTQSQSGYGLLMVSLIVLAAAVVLIVVRMLSG